MQLLTKLRALLALCVVALVGELGAEETLPAFPRWRFECPVDPDHVSNQNGYWDREQKFFKYDNTARSTNHQGVCLVNGTYYDVLGTRAYGTYAQMSDPDDDCTPEDFANDVIDNDVHWDYRWNNDWYRCQ